MQKTIDFLFKTSKYNRFFLPFLIFIPLSMYLNISGASRGLVFLIAVLSIIPLAKFIGDATEEIAKHSSTVIAAILNASFGNSVELIIAFFAIQAGLFEIVKASIVGSIIGNILLILGMSMFFGGLIYKEQKFNTEAVGIASTMLIISVAGLAIPTVYSFTTSNGGTQLLSPIVACVLALIYILGLIFTLFTHKHLFDTSDTYALRRTKPEWSKQRTYFILFFSVLFVAIEAEILVGSMEAGINALGLTQIFVGAVIVAIIGNAAEHSSAIIAALKNNMDLAIEISIGSTTQVALFVVPLLVFISMLIGKPFSLVFSIFQIIAVFIAVMIVNYLSTDGTCNWLEGAQLISVYLIIAAAFYFIV